MTDIDRWRDLQRTNFSELPFDCGNTMDPGVRYCEDLRDWSAKVTTPDQLRMENYIDRYDLRQKRILHVGIGNSGLAQRFQGRVEQIVGTTIDGPEIEVANALALRNYEVVLHNKFSGETSAIAGAFDFILDNNPTSPCCCVRHLGQLLEFYDGKLAPEGQVVTDGEGLAWIPDGANAAWSFSFDDLAAAAAVVGLTATRQTSRTYVLSRSVPPSPGILSTTKHSIRSGRKLVGKLARKGPRLLVRRIAGLGPRPADKA